MAELISWVNASVLIASLWHVWPRQIQFINTNFTRPFINGTETNHELIMISRRFHKLDDKPVKFDVRSVLSDLHTTGGIDAAAPAVLDGDGRSVRILFSHPRLTEVVVSIPVIPLFVSI